MVTPRHGLVTLAALCAAVWACDLTEVVIPAGEPMVVVHGVMRPDLTQQFIVVERTFTGSIENVFDEDPPIPSVGGPQNPVVDATVTVENLDLPDDPCGTLVRFERTPRGSGLLALDGIYWAPPSCPTMRAGDRLSLRIETPEGEVVTGLTRVPGVPTAALTVGTDSAAFSLDEFRSFNRDRDTLRIQTEAAAARLMQVEVHRIGELDRNPGEDLNSVAVLFADALSMAIPGSLIGAADRDEGADIFRAGRRYQVTAAVTDTNYFDFVRSRNNPFTGRGFINHLQGGIGVFGSLAATATLVQAEGDLDDTREGVYRLQGQVQGIEVDAELRLFLARSVEETELSGFLSGSWFRFVEVLPGIGQWENWHVETMSLDGSVAGQDLSLILRQPQSRAVMLVTMRGIRREGVPFQLVVADSAGISLTPLGTLTAAQQ